MFTNKQLRAMIAPLFMEQLLVMLVGVADTFVISFVGEAAVSGVSLVNAFNTIFIYLFTALASGGAVIVSQYIGRRDMDAAGEAASQLAMISAAFSFAVAALVFAAHKPLMALMFGRAEPDVLDACVEYLRISVYSYPALAVYNAGAALYRSVGRTRTTMIISIIANVINVAGNLLGVFVLRAGVAGVAWPSLIARAFSAAAITALCFRDGLGARYRKAWILRWNGELLRRILRVAVPNGVENGIFQLVKVALGSVVALFGTYQIAAYGVAHSIWGLAALVSMAMAPVFITVIGQCMGAGDIAAAERGFRKLVKITLLLSLAWNALTFAATPLLLRFYALADETRRLVLWLVLIHNCFNAIAFPLAGPLGSGLRAAGDVKFTMLLSIASTVLGRLAFFVLLGVALGMGVIGIALAMCLDWVVRAVVFYIRTKRGRWKQFHVI